MLVLFASQRSFSFVERKLGSIKLVFFPCPNGLSSISNGNNASLLNNTSIVRCLSSSSLRSSLHLSKVRLSLHSGVSLNQAAFDKFCQRSLDRR